MGKLEIRKNGKLIDTRWIYDEEKQKGEYVEFDVTDNAIRYLFDTCCLEETLTLKDLFLLLNTNLDQFDLIFGNWLKEIVTEGLTKEAEPYGDYSADNIEWLDLRWYISRDKDSFCGYDRPNFGGVGYKLKKETKPFYKKGSRINWGVSFSSANELINIPLRLNTDFTITNEDSDQGKFMEEIAVFKNATFTLANIIYGVIWELTWNGGPEDRENRRQDLDRAFQEAKNDSKNIKSIR
jgi:hypothetical protein